MKPGMKDKVELVATLVGSAVAVLTYLGVSVSDLWGLAEKLVRVLPFVYVLAGAAIGYGFRAALGRCGCRSAAAGEDVGPTEEDIRESFCTAPFEIKVFLKAILDYQAAYRGANDYVWNRWSQSLAPFVVATNIRNDICRCTLRDSARLQFEQMPDLLADVTDADVRMHAVRGTEGVKPQVMSIDKPIWWYYTDDEALPASCGNVGFMRGHMG